MAIVVCFMLFFLLVGFTVDAVYLGAFTPYGPPFPLATLSTLLFAVTEMALASGCPMPEIYIVYDPAPNAFATGREEKSASVCVTTGLLTLLNREETQ